MIKYTLQPYTTPASRYRCPRCNHRNKTFVRYIDTETGQHLADHVGRCGRENSCGYHYKPRQYFERERDWTARTKSSRWQPRKSTRPIAADKLKNFHCINVDTVNLSIGSYRHNNLVQYMLGQFGTDATLRLLQLYRIGTSKHWPGATVFWQIDTEGNVRTGKVMLYDKQTGRRVKKPFNHITWAHTLLMRNTEGMLSNEGMLQASSIGTPASNFEIRQCLFGEHLLNEHPNKCVAIVESEKTAMIAAAHNDSFIWLAAGSISNLSPQLCKVLKGRHVTLYPDLGAYDKWQAKAEVLKAKIPRTVFNVSAILEQQATADDRTRGLDISDFL